MADNVKVGTETGTLAEIPLLPYEKARMGGPGPAADRLGDLIDEGLDGLSIDDDARPKKGRKSQQRQEELEDDDELETDDDDADEAEDDDEGGEELDDEDGDDSEDEDGEDLYEVQVDGEPLKVTLEELKKRYGQEASFTKKSQRLAEAKKAFESTATETRQLRDEYAQRLEAVKELLDNSQPDEPDERLLDRDPKAYMKAKAALERHQKKVALVQAERKKLAEDAARDAERRDAETLEAEREKLYAAIPEWRDPKVAEKEGSELAEFLRKQGFSMEQIEGLSDHRVILMLRDAMRLRSLKLKGKKLTARPGKSVRPGGRDVAVPAKTRGNKAQAKRAAQKREALARSGRVRDAEAAIFEMLDD